MTVEHTIYRPERDVPKTYTLSELEELTGKPWSYLVRRLVHQRDQLPQPIPPLHKLQVPERLVERISRPVYSDTPSGEWKTVTSTATELDVEWLWVCRRLLSLQAGPEHFEDRLFEENGDMDLHLSPQAIQELRRLREQAMVPIDHSRQFSITEMAERLQRHELWIRNRLFSGDNEVLGLDRSGKTTSYFDQSVLQRLQNIVERTVDSDGWLTLPMICRKVKKDRDWVSTRLEQRGTPSEYRRFAHSGRVDLCFPPSILPVLLTEAKEVRRAPRNWRTLQRMHLELEMSSNWIRPRLKLITGKQPLLKQQMLDEQGVERTHYHPDVFARLKQLRDQQQKPSKSLEGLPEFDRFIAAYDAAVPLTGNNTGKIMQLAALRHMGITEAEITRWKDKGLISIQRANTKPRVYFTTQATTIIEQHRQAETQYMMAVGLRDWLGDLDLI